MFEPVLIISAVYFVVGAGALLVIGRRSDAARKKQLWLKYLTYLFIVYGIIFSTLSGLAYGVVAAAIAVGGLFEISYVFSKTKKVLPFIIALLVYLPLSSCFVYYASVPAPNLHLYVYTQVFVFDGFSQIAGQLFGKRKLSPGVSPNKTIEGLIGGLAMSLLTGSLLVSDADKMVTFVLAIVAASLAGDLLASWYKRLNGVKDYSNLIPGHGGILDRFDSFIAAGAMGLVFWVLA